MSDEDVPAPPLSATFAPNEIILYGVRLNEATGGYAEIAIEATNRFLRMSIIDGGAPVSKDAVSIAVIYGYAFEGHCYRLDKGKILAFSPFSGPVQAQGCSFGLESVGKGYSMWRVSPKTMMLELTVNVDTAQELILESNLPGNRPPNTYGNNMQLAHRAGRLTRNGG